MTRHSTIDPSIPHSREEASQYDGAPKNRSIDSRVFLPLFSLGKLFRAASQGGVRALIYSTSIVPYAMTNRAVERVARHASAPKGLGRIECRSTYRREMRTEA